MVELPDFRYHSKSGPFATQPLLTIWNPDTVKHLLHEWVYTWRFLSVKKCCISRVECSLLFHFQFWWDIRVGRATCKRASNSFRDHSTSSRSFAWFQKMQQRCTSGQQFQTSEINKDNFWGSANSGKQQSSNYSLRLQGRVYSLVITMLGTKSERKCWKAKNNT